MKKCSWCLGSKIYEDYHDNEWGKPLHDDRRLFEMLILESAQAGLSWLTVLRKRENYKKAFDNFDVEKISKYSVEKIEKLLQNEGLIRNRLKINSAIRNAKIFIEIEEKFGSFDKYIWGFVEGKQIKNSYNSLGEIPVKTKLSDKISEDLKKRGMNFVGSTIIYAYMQATGLVNDHVTSCFKYNNI